MQQLTVQYYIQLIFRQYISVVFKCIYIKKGSRIIFYIQLLLYMCTQLHVLAIHI